MCACVYVCSCAELETSTCLYLQLCLLTSQPDSQCYHLMLQVSAGTQFCAFTSLPLLWSAAGLLSHQTVSVTGCVGHGDVLLKALDSQSDRKFDYPPF